MRHLLAIPNEFLYSSARDIADVYRTVCRDGDAVCHLELTVVIAPPTESLFHATIGQHNACTGAVRRSWRLVAAIGDERLTIWPDGYVVGPSDVLTLPFADILPVGLEDLNPPIASIRYVYAPHLIERDTMRQIELAWAVAFGAPLEQKCSSG